MGTMACDRKFRYNTITKRVSKLPYDFEKVDMNTRCNEEVKLFSSARAAASHLNDSIVGVLRPQTEVKITKFIKDINDVFLVESGDLRGWIRGKELPKFMVSFAD